MATHLNGCRAHYNSIASGKYRGQKPHVRGVSTPRTCRSGGALPRRPIRAPPAASARWDRPRGRGLRAKPQIVPARSIDMREKPLGSGFSNRLLVSTTATVQMGSHFTAENAENAEILKKKRCRLSQKPKNTHLRGLCALCGVNGLTH